jgi:Ni/Fe-hydrogenase subunit HybB-like protein
MEVRVKPRLRGVFHEGGFYAAVALAVPLALMAEPGRGRVSAIVFSACLAGCFGASARGWRGSTTQGSTC